MYSKKKAWLGKPNSGVCKAAAVDLLLTCPSQSVRGTSDALLVRRDMELGLAKSAKRFCNAVAVGLPTLVRATLGDKTCYEKTLKVTCLAACPPLLFRFLDRA